MLSLGGGKWQCTDCPYVSKSTNLRYHIESKHVEGSGYNCPQCAKFCRTRNAFNIHMSTYHKQSEKLNAYSLEDVKMF